MELSGKKIAVLGLGREGQALAQYFAKEGINAIFLDENTDVDITTIKRQGFKVVLGQSAFEGLEKYDLVFRSPGIPPHHPKLAVAKNKLTSLTRLFFDLWPGKIIGVTGTKGKGTTASIVKSILKEAKISSVLVGNIGKVDLREIDDFTDSSIAVTELSSFQLMGLGVSPEIAVVLDTTVEHLDYHKSVNEYVSAKLEIVKHQKESDWLVITGLNANYKKFTTATPATVVEVYGDRLKALETKAVWWQKGNMCTNVNQGGPIITHGEFPLAGEHNKINAAAAVAVAEIIGVEKVNIMSAIKNFKNLSQRLESIGSFGGVEFINDSASTNPATTIAAIKSYTKPIVLIIGGKNKGLDYSDLLNTIRSTSHIKKTIIFGALAGELNELPEWKNCPNTNYVETLKEAIDNATQISSAGDVVIFSPGAASFDQFKNYVVRGQKFNHLIHEHFNRKI